MSHDLRWAARYAFTEDLWAARPRVVLDAVLEAALVGPQGDGANDASETWDDAVAELVDALLPIKGEESVWMGVRDAQVAVALGRRRPGTTFVPVDQLADVIARAQWDVALLDLDAVPIPPQRGTEDDALADAAAGLGLRGFGGRHIVAWTAVRGGVDATYEGLADVAVDGFGVRGSTQRIYGLYHPAMAAVVDFGESLEPPEPVDSDPEVTADVGRRREDGEVPLSYDNTLGAQDPEIVELLVITTPKQQTEGLALVELPRGVAEVSGRADGRPVGRPQSSAEDRGSKSAAAAIDAAMRAQLDSAVARADRAEIERLAVVERVDVLARENAELRAQAPASPLAGDGVDAASFDALARDEALEASMAREQALKWRVSDLEHQLGKAIARPVDAMEAEIAQLRAAASNDDAGDEPPRSVSGTIVAPSEPDEPRPPATAKTTAPLTTPAPAASEQPAVRAAALRDPYAAAELAALIRRIERGGIGTLELRRALQHLHRRLRGGT